MAVHDNLFNNGLKAAQASGDKEILEVFKACIHIKDKSECNRIDPEGKFKYAQLLEYQHENGLLNSPEKQKQIYYAYFEAAKSGNIDALFRLGEICRDKLFDLRNEEGDRFYAAASWFYQAMQEKHPKAEGALIDLIKNEVAVKSILRESFHLNKPLFNWIEHQRAKLSLAGKTNTETKDAFFHHQEHSAANKINDQSVASIKTPEAKI